MRPERRREREREREFVNYDLNKYVCTSTSTVEGKPSSLIFDPSEFK